MRWAFIILAQTNFQFYLMFSTTLRFNYIKNKRNVYVCHTDHLFVDSFLSSGSTQPNATKRNFDVRTIGVSIAG